MDLETEFINDVESFFLGTDDNSSESGVSTTEDPFFADDDFFHPSVIHDGEACKAILHLTVGGGGVRVWDLLLLLPNLAFLLFLFWRLPVTRLRLRATSSTAVSVLWSGLLACSLVSTARCLLALLLHLAGGSAVTDTAVWLAARFVFLTAELALALVSLAAGPESLTRRLLWASLAASLTVCSLQAYLEYGHPFYGLKVIATGQQIFGHGGPVFWSVSSFLLVTFYIAVLSSAGCGKMTRPRPFYVYCMVLLGVNLMYGVGATLLAANLHSGLCLTNLAGFTYFSFLPALAYSCLFAGSAGLFAYRAQQDEEVEDEDDAPASVQFFRLDTELQNRVR